MLKNGWLRPATAAANTGAIELEMGRATRGERSSEETLTNDPNGREELASLLLAYPSSSTLVDEDREAEADAKDPLVHAHPYSRIRKSRLRLLSTGVVAATFGACVTTAVLYTWPFPHTVPVFIGLLSALTFWVTLETLSHPASIFFPALVGPPSRFSPARRMAYISALGVIFIAFAVLGVTPSDSDPVPYIHRLDPARPEKYLIAAALYNSEELFAEWSKEVLGLAQHLGPENVFVSIIESYSDDATPRLLLEDFVPRLDALGIRHRVHTGFGTWKAASSDPSAPAPTDGIYRYWPYAVAPERIRYLAEIRNAALAPLSSGDEKVRLQDYQDFTKIVFINDIWFKWQDIIRLITARLDGDTNKASDADLVCATDFGWSGLYDSWVARDVCGTPMRAFWPYVKDDRSVARVRAEEPVDVAACWNGAVVFKADLHLYRPSSTLEQDSRQRHLRKRGWKMVDNSTFAGSRSSPAFQLPYGFRESGIEACDHSECFLFSYDLHRYQRTLNTTSPDRPKIYMHPGVKVAYEKRWWTWHNVVLRIPVIKFWLDHWSRGYPLKLVDWIWEWQGRNRDHCTWAGFVIPDYCPNLPGANFNVGWGSS